MNRRETLALLIAGIAAPFAMTGRARAMAVSLSPAPNASGWNDPCLTRAAAVHDALTLLISDADVTGEWQDALIPLPVSKPWEFSYAYGAASLEDSGQLLSDVVAEVLDGWSSRQPAFMDLQRYKGGMLERKLMVALGWAADRGAAATLFEDLEPGDASPADVVDGVFLRAIAGVDELDATYAQRVFRILYERALMGMHTIEPDLDGWGNPDIASMHEVKNPSPDEVIRYVDAYADWIEGIDAQCERLARASSRKAPTGYPQDGDFYDRSDALLTTVTRLRRGTGTAGVPNAWSAEPTASRYAQSVARAYRNVRRILDIVRGDKPVSTLDALEL